MELAAQLGLPVHKAQRSILSPGPGYVLNCSLCLKLGQNKSRAE
jgi:hypothetical protein